MAPHRARRQWIRRGLLLVVAGFVGLLGARLAYGWWAIPAEPQLHGADAPASSFEVSRKNYASSKYAKSDAGSAAATFDQKYERVADASITSQAFDDDEAALRSIVAGHRGLVQAEQRSGLAPARRLQLAVGVDPDEFDAMVEALRGVGRITRLELRKTDKTNDYLQLRATRRSLEKSIGALTALHQEGQDLSARILLEQELLGREKELQNVGVQLGEFDEENELCTVMVQLVERQVAVTHGPGWPQRLKVAFEWTVPRYLMLLVSLAFGAVFVALTVWLLERLGFLVSRPSPVEPRDDDEP